MTTDAPATPRARLLSVERRFDTLISRTAQTSPWVAATVVLVTLATVAILIYASGGTKNALPHLLYLPIVLSSVSFGFRGAVLTAFVAAVVVGPLMPLNVATGEPQQASGWIVRAAMFLLVAAMASLAVSVRERHLHNQLTAEVRTALSASGFTVDVDTALVPLVSTVLAKRQFHTVFQPIYSLHDGRLLAVEALTRFDAEPQRTPDRWFTAAARAGCGPELELAAIETALEAAVTLPDHVDISINASPETISHPAFVELLRTQTERRLTVEITEHNVIQDYPTLKEHLTTLRAMGVHVAVDDTGAGISSLQHIVQLGPDAIKVDISLTQNVGSSPFRQALASALIELAHRSGAQLVIEGVEDPEDLHTWAAMGAHAAQGYLTGRPQPLPLAGFSPEILTALNHGHIRAQPGPRTSLRA